MKKGLMIQGTGSGAGKSILVAGLCRLFNNRGIRVAPFKAQNMALNSFITKEGGEIGRAQALQAEAARIEPSVDMNPILLKASGSKGCQVIVHGKVWGHFSAKEYYEMKRSLWGHVISSFERLLSMYDLIVIEGAGSPAEINLMDGDIVNMAVAEYTGAPVILVGDIDRGGVFASLYGTVKLLGRRSRLIKAFVINRFRGDPEILRPGLKMIEEKTGRPVIGVIPYLEDLRLPEEDSLALSLMRGFRTIRGTQGGTLFPPVRPPVTSPLKEDLRKIRIVVLRLPYISNFTDFDPFLYEPDVDLLYSTNPTDIENADILIVPGTKNTIKDLLFLKRSGLDESIRRAYQKGIQIIGICGGYQILGKRLSDPHGLEGELMSEVDGIGLLDIETEFQKEKITAQVSAIVMRSPSVCDLSSVDNFKGYEIHKGVSDGDIGLFQITRFPSLQTLPDGSSNNNCWGTYMHGIFENDEFRRAVINSARMRLGLSPLEPLVRYREIKERVIDELSEIIERHIDLSFIWRLLGI